MMMNTVLEYSTLYYPYTQLISVRNGYW